MSDLSGLILISVVAVFVYVLGRAIFKRLAKSKKMIWPATIIVMVFLFTYRPETAITLSGTIMAIAFMFLAIRIVFGRGLKFLK